MQGVEGGYGSESIRQVPRDGYAHVYAKLGGRRIDGVEQGPPAGTVWIQIGAFFYGGEHDVSTGHTTPPTETDILYKAGGDVSVGIADLSLLLAAAVEHHHFEISAPEGRVQALAEATYRVFPWLVGGVRWESSAGAGDGRRRIVPLISALPRLNLKFVTSASFEQRDSLTGGVHVSEIDVGGSYAF